MVQQLETRIDNLEFALGVDDDGPDWVVLVYTSYGGEGFPESEPIGPDEPYARFGLGVNAGRHQWWNPLTHEWQDNEPEQELT